MSTKISLVCLGSFHLWQDALDDRFYMQEDGKDEVYEVHPEEMRRIKGMLNTHVYGSPNYTREVKPELKLVKLKKN